jgi:UDP-glucose:(heptosyl)LPS alpha-1,3-glucosyltransferase
MKTGAKNERSCATAAEPWAGSPKRLRVAVFNRTFSTAGGGAERYSVALVEQLAARHEMHVFAQQIDHHWPGVTYHPVPMPLRKPRWINQLWFAAFTWWHTRSGFDVVHSHENTWHGEVQTVHVLPVKHTLFQGLHGWRLAVRWAKVASSPRLLAYLRLERGRFDLRVDRKVVVTSDSLRSVMASAYPSSEAMLRVITPGITRPDLPVTPERKASARVLLGLPQACRCVLFVANDYRKKGLQALLVALAGGPRDVMLAVVGHPSQQDFFRQEAGRLGLASRVFFLGSLKDVAPAYEAADCLAHPTLEDTFAMAVLEAMSYALPVVVSPARYCGISGLLSHGVNALVLSNPRDPVALGQAIELALAQPLQAQLSRGAEAFADAYEWRRLALQQEAIYLELDRAKKACVSGG